MCIKSRFLLCLLCLGASARADVLKSENTFGVETVEAPTIQYFVSPQTGLTSLVGNGTMDSSAHLGYGFSTGILFSQQLLFEATYNHHAEGLSLPLNSSLAATGILAGQNPSEIYTYSGNTIDLGARIFVFGRDSRFRPYLSGGVGYSWNKLNYSSTALAALGSTDSYHREFDLKQVEGRGGLGLEVALTSLIVVSAQFELSGILSYWASSAQSDSGLIYDNDKLAIANSLSRALSYTTTLGLGFYF